MVHNWNPAVVQHAMSLDIDDVQKCLPYEQTSYPHKCTDFYISTTFSKSTIDLVPTRKVRRGYSFLNVSWNKNTKSVLVSVDSSARVPEIFPSSNPTFPKSRGGTNVSE